jgi:hypothetical protein
LYDDGIVLVRARHRQADQVVGADVVGATELDGLDVGTTELDGLGVLDVGTTELDGLGVFDIGGAVELNGPDLLDEVEALRAVAPPPDPLGPEPGMKGPFGHVSALGGVYTHTGHEVAPRRGVRADGRGPDVTD